MRRTIYLLPVLLFHLGQAQWTQTTLDSSAWFTLACTGTQVYAGARDYPYGVYHSSDEGLTWMLTSAPKEQIWSLWAVDSLVLAGTQSTEILRSTNYGLTWVRTDSGMGDGIPMDIIDAGGDLYTAKGYVYRSTDLGITWTLGKDGLESEPFMAALAANGTSLYAAGFAGSIYRSVDKGINWTFVGGAGVYSRSLLALDSVLFFSTDGGNFSDLFESYDSGKTWTGTKTYGIPLARSGKNVFTGTYQGVSVSSDLGKSWRSVNEGLTYGPQFAHGLAASDHYFFAGVSGVWRRPLAEMIAAGVEKKKEELPGKFMLHQNFPNPFNPATTIQYTLLHRSHVTLIIYNTLGQQVAQLVNGETDAGYHAVQFDGSNVASGVYFYCMHAGNFVATRKLLLIR